MQTTCLLLLSSVIVAWLHVALFPVFLLSTHVPSNPRLGRENGTETREGGERFTDMDGGTGTGYGRDAIFMHDCPIAGTTPRIARGVEANKGRRNGVQVAQTGSCFPSLCGLGMGLGKQVGGNPQCN